MSWPESYAPKWTAPDRPVGMLPLLEKILTGVPKLDGARCVGKPELFDVASLDRVADAAEALALCESCAAIDTCGRYADSQSRRRRLRGVIAGRWYLRPKNGAQNSFQP